MTKYLVDIIGYTEVGVPSSYPPQHDAVNIYTRIYIMRKCMFTDDVKSQMTQRVNMKAHPTKVLVNPQCPFIGYIKNKLNQK